MEVIHTERVNCTLTRVKEPVFTPPRFSARKFSKIDPMFCFFGLLFSQKYHPVSINGNRVALGWQRIGTYYELFWLTVTKIHQFSGFYVIFFVFFRDWVTPSESPAKSHYCNQTNWDILRRCSLSITPLETF